MTMSSSSRIDGIGHWCRFEPIPDKNDIWLLKKKSDDDLPRKTVKKQLTELCDRLDAIEALEKGKTAFLNGENEFAVSLVRGCNY